MTLELFYVKGINSTDTMYFASKEEQDAFFLTEPSRIILNDFSFYPPHFKNTITLSSDDLNFNSNINYLRLSYNDKYYYYFISSVRYVAEDIIEIDITMDVIQTYLFNINFNYVDVERRLINRRTGLGIINRNYIRENFSSNDFILRNYEDVEDLCIIDIVSTNTIFNISKENNDSIKNFEKFSTFANFNTYGNKPFSDGLVHYYIPYSKTKNIKIKGEGQKLFRNTNNNFELSYTHTYEETTLNGKDIMNLIYRFSDNPSVIAINFIPFNFFNYSDINFSKNEDSYIIDVPSTSKIIITNVITYIGNNYTELKYVLCLGFSSVASQGSDNVGRPFGLSRVSFSYDLNSKVKITQNTERLKSYSTEYLPQLLDSNYRKIEYGERISYNVFPLEELISLDNFAITCKYLLESGKRGYTLTAKCRITDISKDPYLSTFVVSSKESFTLKNDSRKTYIAQNKATLTTGLAFKYLQGMFKGGAQILQEKPINAITSAISPYIDYQVTKENLEYTPDTITQGNNAVDNYMINSNNIMFRDFTVRDYDRVAEIYTKIGFKVSEHYSNINIINELNTRYYYNYIKCGDLSIYLDVINDDNTLTKIIERFRDGLRFWNINNCKTDNLEMGNLFKYDNVEKIFLK